MRRRPPHHACAHTRRTGSLPPYLRELNNSVLAAASSPASSSPPHPAHSMCSGIHQLRVHHTCTYLSPGLAVIALSFLKLTSHSHLATKTPRAPSSVYHFAEGPTSWAHPLLLNPFTASPVTLQQLCLAPFSLPCHSPATPRHPWRSRRARMALRRAWRRRGTSCGWPLRRPSRAGGPLTPKTWGVTSRSHVGLAPFSVFLLESC